MDGGALNPLVDATVPCPSATALHYGQSLFEGLKAFACKDGSVRLFRRRRTRRGWREEPRGIMEAPDEALFVEACSKVVRENLITPPYGSGGALYIRPLLYYAGPE